METYIQLWRNRWWRSTSVVQQGWQGGRAVNGEIRAINKARSVRQLRPIRLRRFESGKSAWSEGNQHLQRIHPKDSEYGCLSARLAGWSESYIPERDFRATRAHGLQLYWERGHF